MNEVLTFDALPSAVGQVLERLTRIEAILKKPTEPPKPHRLDFKGALHYLSELGYRVSKSQMQKKTADGTIPCSKFNGRLVFDRTELDAWVECNSFKVGDNGDAALMLAKSANRKLKRK